MNSDGFKAWLKTTDDRLPLSNYMTVLEGTAEMWARVEAELAQLKEDCAPFQAQIDQRKICAPTTAQIDQRKTYEIPELPPSDDGELLEKSDET